jgi:membrane-associated phospholipid phosphatase
MSNPRRAGGGAVGARPSARRAVLVAGAAIALVWAAAIAFGVLRPSPFGVDLRWDALMTTEATPAGTAVARVLAVVGTGVPATALMLLVAAAVAWTRGWAWAGVVVATSAVSALDVHALKAIAARSRPDEVFGTANAFPSGHTTAAVLLAALVVLLYRHVAVQGSAVVYAVAMAWSRTAIHAHWLTDVLAGAVLGTATAVLAVGVAGIGMRRRDPLAGPRTPRGLLAATAPAVRP